MERPQLSFDDICRLVGHLYLDTQHQLYLSSVEKKDLVDRIKEQHDVLLKHNQSLSDEVMKYKAEAMELSQQIKSLTQDKQDTNGPAS